MPESKKRKKVVERRIAQQHAEENRYMTEPEKRSPKWWVPVMIGFASSVLWSLSWPTLPAAVSRFRVFPTEISTCSLVSA